MKLHKHLNEHPAKLGVTDKQPLQILIIFDREHIILSTFTITHTLSAPRHWLSWFFYHF